MSFYKKNRSIITFVIFIVLIALSILSVMGIHATAKDRAAQANQVYIDYNYLISFVNLYNGNTTAAISDYQKVLPYLKSANIYNEYANILLYAKKYNQAEIFLQKAITIFPNNKNLYEKLLDIYVIKGEDAKAINLMKKNKNIFKNSSTVYKRIGILYMRNKNYSKAITYFKKIKDYVKDKKILYYIVECYNAMGRMDKAILYATKLVSVSGNVSSQILLAGLYEKTKQYEKAIKLYKTMNIEDGLKLSSIGNDYYLAGNLNKAFLYFKKAYEVHNNISYAGKALYMLMRLGKYQDVITFVKKENIPLKTNRIIYFYGVALMSEKQYVQAIEIFKKISPSSILYKDALYNEVVCYTKLKEKNEAIKVLLSVKQKDKDIYYMLSDLYLKYKDYKKAILTIKNNMNKLQDKADAYFYIADIYYDKLKDKNEAVKYLTQSLKINPNDPIVLNYLGYLLINENIDIDKGINLVKKALKINPDNPYYLDSLGWGYFKKGEYRKSLMLLKKAIKYRKNISASDNAIIEIHLSKVYIKMGEKKSAKMLLKRIVKQFPKNKKAKTLLDNLK